MNIFKKIFRKNAIERGFRYLIKPGVKVSFVGKEVMCLVRDISIGGIGLVSNEFVKQVSSGEEIQASVMIGERILTLDVKVVWARGDRAGVKVITHRDYYSENVRDFIESINS